MSFGDAFYVWGWRACYFIISLNRLHNVILNYDLLFRAVQTGHIQWARKTYS